MQQDLTRVRSLFLVNLKYGISMFLLVISVNHTNTIFKVSLWILLTRKSLDIGGKYVMIGNQLMLVGSILGVAMKLGYVLCIVKLGWVLSSICDKLGICGSLNGNRCRVHASNLYPNSCSHKRISLHYLVASVLFGITGTIISLEQDICTLLSLIVNSVMSS